MYHLIRQVRITRGLNQSSFAKLLDVSQSTISRWEKGLSKPDLKHRDQLINKFIRKDGINELSWSSCVRMSPTQNILLDNNLTIIEISDSLLNTAESQRRSVIAAPYCRLFTRERDLKSTLEHRMPFGFHEKLTYQDGVIGQSSKKRHPMTVHMCRVMIADATSGYLLSLIRNTAPELQDPVFRYVTYTNEEKLIEERYSP